MNLEMTSFDAGCKVGKYNTANSPLSFPHFFVFPLPFCPRKFRIFITMLFSLEPVKQFQARKNMSEATGEKHEPK